MHLPLLLHILALSSGAWTRAFGFTVQKLHLSLAPFSKIDVPRPFHTLLHSNSRYTLGKGICSKPQVSGLDAFGLSKANPAHRSFCGIRIRFHQRWKFHSQDRIAGFAFLRLLSLLSLKRSILTLQCLGHIVCVFQRMPSQTTLSYQ